MKTAASSMPDSGTAPGVPRIAPLTLAVLLPALFVFTLLLHLAPFAPYQDDYGAILQFADHYHQVTGWETRVLRIATEQSNEYKLAFEHAVVAGELELTHRLNFTFLTVVGDVFLLPIAFLLCLVYGPGRTAPFSTFLHCLPISLLFFSMTYWETLDWAMTGLQNVPVILFSLLAVYLLSRNARWFLLCLAAMLAAFSSANGFLLLPIGVLMLLPRRAYGAAIAWCLYFLVPLAAYLYHYQPGVVPRHSHFMITRLLFFFVFLGSAIPSRWPALVLGIAVSAVLILSARRGFHRSNPAGFFFALWVMATSAMVAWVRGAAGVYTASRYSIYSVLMLVCCYGFFSREGLAKQPAKLSRSLAIGAALAGGVFVLSNLYASHKLAERRRMVLAGLEHYRANPEKNSPMIDPLVVAVAPQEIDREKNILTHAIQQGIYVLPPPRAIR
jgi:hypothetical protein